jgi:cell division protein FtsB
MKALTPSRVVQVALLGVAAYYALWGGEYSALDLVRLDRLQKEETEVRDRTMAQADSLRELVSRLENDPVTIERVARERFGMLREGELLYRFVPVAESSEEDVHIAASP